MTKQKVLKPSVKERKPSYLLEFESVELRNDFKSYCSRKGLNMKDVLNNMIKEKVLKEEV